MFVELLRARLAGICEVSDEQAEKLRAHYELLCRWNKVINLTAVRRLEEAVERHYCESIFLARYLPEGRFTVADAGSGAGFPGIPVAVKRPELGVTLIESHQRKAAFLREASRGLGNVRVLARRAEDLADQFDWVISRAVTFADIAVVLKRLGRRVALLTGAVEPSGLPGFEWEEPVRLPWGEQRWLWMSVPRETQTS